MNLSQKYLKFAAFLEAPMWLILFVLVVVTLLVVATSFIELGG